MWRCLTLAGRAQAQGEVPVGAVLVKDDALVAEGWNRSISSSDPSAHAEIVALREAGRVLGNYRLPGTTLYVTLEPCSMCVGALIHARVGRLVFGAPDPKSGPPGSVFDLIGLPRYNHRIAVTGGVLEGACAEQLRAFFRARRGRGRAIHGSCVS
jgi:tRNA(adenine34) deaminase